mgnify:CR=1 FL=1
MSMLAFLTSQFRHTTQRDYFVSCCSTVTRKPSCQLVQFCYYLLLSKPFHMSLRGLVGLLAQLQAQLSRWGCYCDLDIAVLITLFVDTHTTIAGMALITISWPCDDYGHAGNGPAPGGVNINLQESVVYCHQIPKLSCSQAQSLVINHSYTFTLLSYDRV